MSIIPFSQQEALHNLFSLKKTKKNGWFFLWFCRIKKKSLLAFVLIWLMLTLFKKKLEQNLLTCREQSPCGRCFPIAKWPPELGFTVHTFIWPPWCSAEIDRVCVCVISISGFLIFAHLPPFSLYKSPSSSSVSIRRASAAQSGLSGNWSSSPIIPSVWRRGCE